MVQTDQEALLTLDEVDEWEMAAKIAVEALIADPDDEQKLARASMALAAVRRAMAMYLDERPELRAEIAAAAEREGREARAAALTDIALSHN